MKSVYHKNMCAEREVTEGNPAIVVVLMEKEIKLGQPDNNIYIWYGMITNSADKTTTV